MSSIIESLDRLQKEEKHAAPKTAPVSDNTPKESLFSRFGILLWLGASISATVFSYHLGVTQGMQAVKEESPKEWLRYFSEFTNPQPAQAPQAPAAPKGPSLSVLKALGQVPVKETSAPAAEVKKTDEETAEPEAKKRGFTIQVITYVSERLAKEEVERLAQKGHKAFVVPSGKYFQVCLDLFEDKKGAIKKLNGLRKIESYKSAYPGAYVKFLKQ